MNKYIYPEVRINRTQDEIIFETTLRKEHQGIWYDWFIKDRYVLRENATPNTAMEKLNLFHNYVYRVSVLGKHNNHIDKSESQDTEEERLSLRGIP